jgi:hypothetical protein
MTLNISCSSYLTTASLRAIAYHLPDLSNLSIGENYYQERNPTLPWTALFTQCTKAHFSGFLLAELYEKPATVRPEAEAEAEAPLPARLLL